MEKPNYYANIPATVRYDNDLPPNAKLLYGEITALANREGFCWASNAYFAELYGVSRSTVSEWVSKLADKSYIYLRIKNKNQRKIYIEHPSILDDGFPKNPKGVSGKAERGVSGKAEHNNTSTNNTNKNPFSSEKDSSLVVQEEDVVYEEVDDRGEPLKDSFGRKKGEKPTVKKQANWLIAEFKRQCKRHLDFEPVTTKGWYFVALKAVKEDWTDKQILTDHMTEWFLDDEKTDEEVISFTACFSSHQLNRLKLKVK